MNSEQARQVVTYLRRVALVAGGPGSTDGELLAQFAASRDESAFAALMHRHGPMVLNVCRRILRHQQDAEDAFQATFMIFARKAQAINNRQAVGTWLYSVAYRTALGAKTMRARRQEKEQQIEPTLHAESRLEKSTSELVEMLDPELSRLPEKYRLPVVLCELEGRSRKEVARQLGLPEGTLSSRLATARQMLLRRLNRYGPPVSVVVLGTLLTKDASPVVPALLIASTVKALTGAISAPVTALTERMVRSMLFAKLKGIAWIMVLTASLGAGGAGLAYQTVTKEAQKPAEPVVDEPDRPVKKLDAPVRDELEALRLELAALRKDLQVTRERVQALETAQGKLQDWNKLRSENPSLAEEKEEVEKNPQTFTLNQNSFKIPFRIAPERRSGIREVRLYVSQDQGKTWKLHVSISPDESFFSFNAVRDGQYWFIVAFLDSKGRQEPVDIYQAPVCMRVIVDTHTTGESEKVMPVPLTVYPPFPPSPAPLVPPPPLSEEDIPSPPTIGDACRVIPPYRTPEGIVPEPKPGTKAERQLPRFEPVTIYERMTAIDGNGKPIEYYQPITRYRAVTKNGGNKLTEAETALKQLREHPGDKQALDALQQAIEHLKRQITPAIATPSVPVPEVPVPKPEMSPSRIQPSEAPSSNSEKK